MPITVALHMGRVAALESPCDGSMGEPWKSGTTGALAYSCRSANVTEQWYG
jgi:hypothetical protein